MNDYVTMKTIDMRRADATRRQRNADHLAVLEQPTVSLRERLHQWWMRLLPSSTDTLAERTARLQAPTRVSTAECSLTGQP